MCSDTCVMAIIWTTEVFKVWVLHAFLLLRTGINSPFAHRNGPKVLFWQLWKIFNIIKSLRQIRSEIVHHDVTISNLLLDLSKWLYVNFWWIFWQSKGDMTHCNQLAQSDRVQGELLKFTKHKTPYSAVMKIQREIHFLPIYLIDSIKPK